jgi:BlaI family transcriptional regulator, penicillinase repressor
MSPGDTLRRLSLTYDIYRRYPLSQMARTPRPTAAELAILRVLWTRGPSTVREVHDAMASSRSVAYTTTLKMLQVMTGKGLTMREDHRGQHRYRPRHAEAETQRRLVTDLLDRAFGGSTSKLVIQALTSRRASAEELREIRRLLDARSADKDTKKKEKDHE